MSSIGLPITFEIEMPKNHVPLSTLLKAILCQLLLLMAFSVVAHSADLVGTSAGMQSSAKQSVERHSMTPLEMRVIALSKALDLDAVQQQQLRQVLQHQQQQMLSVWRNTDLPSGYRISVTRAISNHAADQIRALLNDEQLKRYKPAVSHHEAAGRSVEEWMSAARPSSVVPNAVKSQVTP